MRKKYEQPIAELVEFEVSEIMSSTGETIESLPVGGDIEIEEW